MYISEEKLRFESAECARMRERRRSFRNLCGQLTAVGAPRRRDLQIFYRIYLQSILPRQNVNKVLEARFNFPRKI